MQQESVSSSGSSRDPDLPRNNADKSTKLNQNELNQQPIKTVEQNYAIQDNIFEDVNKKESGSEMNSDYNEKIQKQIKNKNNEEYKRENNIKIEKLSAKANIEDIADAMCEESSITDPAFVKELADIIRKGQKLSGMREALDKLAHKIICPMCDQLLSRGRGRPSDELWCGTHGKLDMFNFAYQLPKEVVVAYLEKVEKSVLHLYIIQLNKIAQCKIDEQNAGNDLFMDVCETKESNNSMESNAEQDERINEESVNQSICPANVSNEEEMGSSIPMQMDTEETKMDISPATEEAGYKMLKNSQENQPVEKNANLINSPVNGPETTVQVVNEQMSNTAQESDKQVAPRRIEPIELINMEKNSPLNALFNSVDFADFNNPNRVRTNFEMACQGKSGEEKNDLICYAIGNISKKLDFIIENIKTEKTQKNIEKEITQKKENQKINDNVTIQKQDGAKQSYLEAAMNGKKTGELTKRQISQMCSYTYVPKQLESYKTIHFRGIKKAPYNLVWTMLVGLGVDKHKVKFLIFVDYDTLEFDVYESYVNDLTKILEQAYKKSADYRNLIIKRIVYEEKYMEMNTEKNESPFQKRMAFKLEKIKSLLPKAPHLRRLHNYVALQIKSNSLNITMKTSLEYEESMTAYVDSKLNEPKKIKMDIDNNVAESEDNNIGVERVSEDKLKENDPKTQASVEMEIENINGHTNDHE